MRYYSHFNLAMVSSLGFGSTSSNAFALFRLAFALAPAVSALTLLLKVTRRLILQEARHHPALQHWALTDCKRTVSGSISLP
jgi:hypothetical protein